MRKQNALQHKLFLIERPLPNTFKILGTTRNVYTVTIDVNPKCTCPDFMTRHKRCKHIYFVLIRILKVQNPEATEFLKDICDGTILIDGNFVVDNAIKKIYQQKLNINNSIDIIDIKGLDDDCPICMDAINTAEYDYCKNSCKRAVHKYCIEFTQMAKCPTCMMPWNNKQQQYIKL